MRTKKRHLDNKKDMPGSTTRSRSHRASSHAPDDENWEEWSADDLDDLSDFFSHINDR